MYTLALTLTSVKGMWWSRLEGEKRLVVHQLSQLALLQVLPPLL